MQIKSSKTETFKSKNYQTAKKWKIFALYTHEKDAVRFKK